MPLPAPSAGAVPAGWPGLDKVEVDAARLRLARLLADASYRFTTGTPATHARVNARPRNAWARGVEDVFGWSRPFRTGVLPAPLFAAMQDADVLAEAGSGWRSTIRFSTLDGHLFMHSAFPTAGADAVFFGPDTYRFAAALDAHLASRTTLVARAIDIGCGAGPGAVLIALRRPEAVVVGSDINPEALRFAALNAQLAQAANVELRASDLLADVDGTFDLIVANPPYLLDGDKRAYRHGGGERGEGLSIAIAELAAERLSPGGTLVLYTGSAIVAGDDALRSQLAERFAAAGLGWDYREVDPDVFGEELAEPAYDSADRIAAVVATATRSH